MDASFVAIALHSIERIVAVLLGGLSIYYGYRLFLAVPFQNASDGKIKLAGISVVLSKAGPGVFFAAFGAMVIGTSLSRPVEVQHEGGKYVGGTEQTAAWSAGAPGRQAPAAHEVARVRLALQNINCAQRIVAVSQKAHAAELEVSIRDAKLALLASVWDTAAWGDLEAFRRWAGGDGSVTKSPAQALFAATRPDCTARGAP